LDIDLVREAVEPFRVETVIDLVDDLHAREKVAFEAAITDDARRLFDAV
jgi:uncharacterized protein (TIGR04255 family)